MNRCLTMLAVAVAVGSAAGTVRGQGTGSAAVPIRTQVIELEAGWNAVWLEVEPLEKAAEKVFAETPVDVCARYFLPVTTGDFISDPAERPWNKPGWGVWYAPGREEAVVRSLGTVKGHTGYLVHSERAHRWELSGAVTCEPVVWRHGAFTLAGFPVEAGGAPTFREFFAGSQGRVGRKIYRLTGGRWQLASADAVMRPGEACWILAEGDSHYQGPLGVEVATGGLDFGSAVGTLTLAHTNASGADQAPVVEVAAAGGAAAGLPLERLEFAEGTLAPTARAVAGALTEVAPGETGLLRLRVRRDLMLRPEQCALLKISDGAGALAWVPVRASR